MKGSDRQRYEKTRHKEEDEVSRIYIQVLRPLYKNRYLSVYISNYWSAFKFHLKLKSDDKRNFYLLC